MNCIRCGITILDDESARYCPACAENEQLKGPSVKKSRFRLLALIPIAIFVALAFMLISTYCEGETRSSKGYDAAASSTLKNIQSYCETYFIDDMKYPDNLDSFGKDSISKDMQIEPANGVKTDYLPAKDRKSYIVTSSHPEGKKIFKLVSDKPGILYRLKKEQDSAYRPL